MRRSWPDEEGRQQADEVACVHFRVLHGEGKCFCLCVRESFYHQTLDSFRTGVSELFIEKAK